MRTPSLFVAFFAFGIAACGLPSPADTNLLVDNMAGLRLQVSTDAVTLSETTSLVFGTHAVELGARSFKPGVLSPSSYYYIYAKGNGSGVDVGLSLDKPASNRRHRIGDTSALLLGGVATDEAGAMYPQTQVGHRVTYSNRPLAGLGARGLLLVDNVSPTAMQQAAINYTVPHEGGAIAVSMQAYATGMSGYASLLEPAALQPSLQMNVTETGAATGATGISGRDFAVVVSHDQIKASVWVSGFEW